MTKIVITVADEDAVYLNRDRYDLAGLDLALSKITKTTASRSDRDRRGG
jgi:hypothetical protein